VGARGEPSGRARAAEQLPRALSGLAKVLQVRAPGLLVAAELAPGLEAAAVAGTCLDRGLVLNAVTPTSLRFAPSLLVTDDEIAEAVAILGAVLGESGEGEA